MEAAIPLKGGSKSLGREAGPALAPIRVGVSPVTLLGKRDSEGKQRPPQSSRMPSRYRGCTNHTRTGRFEAHIWESGKQIYLGGYFSEEQAAMAYDLGAVILRGRDAILNFPDAIYAQEMAEAHLVSREEVVQCLRSQSKEMNKVDTSGTLGGDGPFQLQDWELAVSEAIHQDSWEHLGVFASDAEAARAVDRAQIARRGIEAALNFALADYVDQLDASQLEAAISRGLISSSSSQPPSPIPVPLRKLPQPLAPLAPIITTAPGPDGAATTSSLTRSGGLSPGAADGGLHSPVSTAPAMPHKPLVTPTSVLNYESAVAAAWAEEHCRLAQLSGKPTGDFSPSKLPRLSGEGQAPGNTAGTMAAAAAAAAAAGAAALHEDGALVLPAKVQAQSADSWIPDVLV